MAQGMKLFGKFARIRFAVVPNDKCRGLGLCTQACPMGIDVASYAHINKKPIAVAFGLDETPCIGCGGCIDVCPVDALAFTPIRSGWGIVSRTSTNATPLVALPIIQPDGDARHEEIRKTSA